MHFYTGIRGRAATRFVLLAYLFLTLAYPGVKFVRDVLLSSELINFNLVYFSVAFISFLPNK